MIQNSAKFICVKNNKKTVKGFPQWFFPAAIILLVFIIYGNSLKNKYSLDDEYVTSTPESPNARIEKGFKGIPEIFKSRYAETGLQRFSYRPLVLVSFAIEYQFFKANPAVSHFINILLFALICLLIFYILSDLFKDYNKWLPLFITLLFAVHPIHTEVVDSIKNRDELMSFFFGLISLHSALKYIRRKNILSLVISIAFIIFAMITKETSMVFILVIPVTLYFFREIKISRLVITVFSVAVLLFIFALLRNRYLIDSASVRHFVFTENPLFFTKNPGLRISAAFYILLFYMKLMLIPFPLCAYYGYNTIPIADWTEPLVWFSLAIHAAMCIYIFKKFKSKNVLVYSFIFYLICIVPYSNIIQPAAGIVAERFALPASLAFCIIFIFLLFNLFRIPVRKTETDFKMPSYIIALLGIVFLIFSSFTISRNRDWKDLRTLFNRDLKYYNNSYNLHYIMANSISNEVYRIRDADNKKIKINEAMTHYRKIAEIVESGIKHYTDDAISLNNLGSIYVNYLNKPQAALPLFKQALVINPAYTEAFFDMGFCYEKLNKPDSSIYFYKRTLDLDKHYAEAYRRLNIIYLQKNSADEAIVNAENGLRSFPNTAEFYVYLGNAQLIRRDTISGIKSFESAIKAEPANVNMRSQIMGFFAKADYNPSSKTWKDKPI